MTCEMCDGMCEYGTEPYVVDFGGLRVAVSLPTVTCLDCGDEYVGPETQAQADRLARVVAADRLDDGDVLEPGDEDEPEWPDDDVRLLWVDNDAD